MENMSGDSSLFSKAKDIFKRQKRSPFVRDYLLTANARSSVYVSAIVAALEIWMLAMMIFGIIEDSENYTREWLISHTIAYISLLAISVVLLAYSILYLKGRVTNRAVGRVIKAVFSIAMVAFGLYISYTSKDRGGQVFAFITTLVFLNCLLVWHPIISFVGLTVVFAIYIYMQSKLIPISLSIKVNAFTTWLAFYAAALNSHHQKRVEAQKDERLCSLNKHLEKKSLYDDLTDLPNRHYFYKAATEFLADKKNHIEDYCFAFMDIENFKNYNEKYGFVAGTEFLRSIARILQEVFGDELLARFSDDHFVALTRHYNLSRKIKKIQKEINKAEDIVQLGLKVGIYRPKERDCAPNLACDHARYACEFIKKHFGRDLIEYDSKMDKVFNQKLYIINNIDQAIEKDFIKVYYQPVVLAQNGKLCGVEALARWEDPKFGMLSPAAFVPILEEYHLIHKLDMRVMEIACKDIKECADKKLPFVPVSINFSRLDFELIDPAEELERCIKKYGLSKSDIHVEITESALSSSDEKLKLSLETFRKNGNSLWLDDFGSGYSGLNVLKDYSFDLMKIDMAFLSQFSKNKKAEPILTSIVSLAQKIGMQTLSEGVETQEAYDFLKSIGCQRLQGFLFGKPMPKDELVQKIQSGFYRLSA